MTKPTLASESVQFSLKGLIILTAVFAVLAAISAPLLRELPAEMLEYFFGLTATACGTVVLTILFGGWQWRRLFKLAGERLIDIRSSEALRTEAANHKVIRLLIIGANLIGIPFVLRAVFWSGFPMAHGSIALLCAVNTGAWIANRTRWLRTTEIDLREHGIICWGWNFISWSDALLYDIRVETIPQRIPEWATGTLQQRVIENWPRRASLAIVIKGGILMTAIDPLQIERINATLTGVGLKSGDVEAFVKATDRANDLALPESTRNRA